MRTPRFTAGDPSPRIAGASYKRERWDQNQAAAETMCRHSHSDAAPWLLISGKQKRHARIAVLSAALAHWQG